MSLSVYVRDAKSTARVERIINVQFILHFSSAISKDEKRKIAVRYFEVAQSTGFIYFIFSPLDEFIQTQLLI